MSLQSDVKRILKRASTLDFSDSRSIAEERIRVKSVREADVEVIVRCKDCKYYENHECQKNGGTWGRYDYCNKGR